MKHRYLEVTFREGRPMAAYLYLPRLTGVKSARTERRGHGLLVDYGDDGTAIGIEITDPRGTSVDDLNAVLLELGAEGIEPDELSPLRAA